jgi:hypothetical protein
MRPASMRAPSPAAPTGCNATIRPPAILMSRRSACQTEPSRSRHSAPTIQRGRLMLADTIRDMMRPHQTDASSRLAAHGDGSYLS